MSETGPWARGRDLVPDGRNLVPTGATGPDGRDLVPDVRARVGALRSSHLDPVRAPAARGVPRPAELARHVSAAAAARAGARGRGPAAATVAEVRDHAWGLGPSAAAGRRPRGHRCPGERRAVRSGSTAVAGCGGCRVDVGGGGRASGRSPCGWPPAAGRRLDESVPWVDARLPGGVRLHAVIPPVAPSGTHLSLRVLRAGRLDLETLVSTGCIAPGWREVLATAGRRGGRRSWSPAERGRARPRCWRPCCPWCRPQERLVLVEDVGELRPAHPHVVRLEARHANVEGRGGVDAGGAWSGRRCGCGPTGSWSGSAADPRSGICWPRSTPVTRAGAAPCTPTRRPRCRPGWRRSACWPDSAVRRSGRRLPRPWTPSCTWTEVRTAVRRVVEVAAVCRDAGRVLEVRTALRREDPAAGILTTRSARGGRCWHLGWDCRAIGAASVGGDGFR